MKIISHILITLILLFLHPLVVYPDQGVNVHIPLVIQVDRPKSAQWGQKELRFLATHYKGISDRTVNFSKDQIQYLKQINNKIFIIKYLSATTIHGKVADKVLQRIPEAALYDLNKNPIPPLWSKNGKARGIVFNPAHKKWYKFLFMQGKKIQKKGYDGIMLDECLMANQLPDNFCGINPATCNLYTTKEFRQAVFSCIGQLKKEMGENFLLIANSVAYGKKYWEEDSHKFLKVLDGVIAEGFRGPFFWPNTKLFGMDAFKQNIDMLVDVEKAGKYCIAMVKYQKTNTFKMSSKIKRQLDIFHLSCFLLGKGEKSGLSSNLFDKTQWKNADKSFNPLWYVKVGEPTGNYYISKGIFQRNYTLSKILANPSPEILTLNLKKSYFTLEGKAVNHVILKPFTGAILLKYKETGKTSAN
jgi:hypothetical protein